MQRNDNLNEQFRTLQTEIYDCARLNDHLEQNVYELQKISFDSRSQPEFELMNDSKCGIVVPETANALLFELQLADQQEQNHCLNKQLEYFREELATAKADISSMATLLRLERDALCIGE